MINILFVLLIVKGDNEFVEEGLEFSNITV